MGAECHIHGTDLCGDTLSGLVCPVCEVEQRTDRLANLLDRLYGLCMGQEHGGIPPCKPTTACEGCASLYREIEAELGGLTRRESLADTAADLPEWVDAPDPIGDFGDRLLALFGQRAKRRRN